MISYFIKHFVFPLGEWIREEPIRKYLREFEKSQWLKQEELQELQFDKMVKILKYANDNIPYYKNAFKEKNISWKDIKSIEDWRKLPLLTKDDLRSKADQMKSITFRGKRSIKTTGGSTGQAVTIEKDRNATAYLRAAMWRSYRWHGIDFGDKQARFWGIPLSYSARRKYEIIDYLTNRIRLSAFKFNDDELLIYYKKLVGFKPTYFYGYVSAILAFAEFLQEKGLDPDRIGVKVIITTAEELHENQKKYIEDIFHCKVRNEYGCGEVGPIAMECPEGSMHVNSDNLFIEFLDNEGETEPNIKEIVITELNSYLMPLIRYNVKDYALISDEKCLCGRGLPIIKRIIGRYYDWIISENNKYFHGEYFMYLLEEMKRKNMGVKQFQIIQESREKLRIRILWDNNSSAGAISFIEHALHEQLGKNIEFEFETVKNIPREKSGKIRLIINKIR